jgi:hypothetical protein
VLDRVNGVAYVALSERADRQLAEQWVSSLGYKDLVTFSSSDCRGKPVYHTNVMMAIGTDVAVVCADSVTDAKERQHLLVGGSRGMCYVLWYMQLMVRWYTACRPVCCADPQRGAAYACGLLCVLFTALTRRHHFPAVATGQLCACADACSQWLLWLPCL